MSKKSLILHAATRLFARQGFKDTSMVDLAKATDSAGSTILYHFNNKEELFLAILAETENTIRSDFDKHYNQSNYENGMEMIEGTISFYLKLASDMEDRFLLLHRHDPYALAEINPDCRKHLENIYACLLDTFERALKRGQEDGTIREMPTRKAALIVFSLVDGIVRLNTYKLYEGNALYQELFESCYRMLKP